MILKLHFPYRDARSVPLVFANFPLEVSSVRLGLLFRPQLVAVVLLQVPQSHSLSQSPTGGRDQNISLFSHCPRSFQGLCT